MSSKRGREKPLYNRGETNFISARRESHS